MNLALGSNNNDVWWDKVVIAEVGADGAAPVAEVEEVAEIEEEAPAVAEEPAAEKPAKKSNTALIIGAIVAVVALVFLLGKK